MTHRYSLQSAPPKTSKIDYGKELNPEQLRVVTSGGGPTMVLAGPGSGKTRTLTYRVAYLLEQGIDPRRILLVTFTVKAARQMLERVEQIMGHRPENLWGGTFHHIGNVLLRRHADLIRRTPAFGILDKEDSQDLIAACIADLKIPLAKTRLPQANVLGNLFSLSSNTLQPLETLVPEAVPQFADQLPFVQRVSESYRKRKEQGNLLDYDDLLALWLAVLKENPAVRKTYGEQFQYILVDEYQDTNRLQFEIVRSLAEEHRNLLVVGDDAQSIYAFRGAEVENLLRFPEVFPGTSTFRLETNYRSTPEILSLANASIQLNSRQFQKELKSLQSSGPLPAVVPLVDLKQQAAFIAQRVLELRAEGTSLEEIGVLFRARFQAAELELELAKRNIPYVVRGGIRFFEQAHIKDVLAHLRVLANPRDEMAWERILRLQEGIGPAYARRIWEVLSAAPDPLEKARGGGEEAGKLLPARSAAAWGKLRRTLQELRDPQKSDNPAEALATVIQSGYLSTLETRFEDARDRKEDLEQLVNLASSYVSIAKFIEDLTLREPFKGESVRGWEKPDEFLALSTIHQAKGLEWTCVFLIGLTEGQFPHPKSFQDPAEMEEERRLFYVAVTRAKKELYLTYPLTRYSYDKGQVLMRPSQFIQELPEELFELWRVGDDQPFPEDSEHLL
ncbi:MAG: ATP-dependent helicase [Candidatus Omnitrophota bacterium]|nr:ATP-dependent helicase [Candidatus Omnitrophota bacterium]